MKPTVGRTVHYILTAQDALSINKRRTTPDAVKSRAAEGKWSQGAQAHMGNPAQEGQHMAAVIVAAWGNQSCNLQVLLDGTDSHWVTSVGQGDTPGTWHWPEREE